MTRDRNDVGVPMRPGADHQGPEDALDPEARGDYSDRMKRGPLIEVVPDEGLPTHDGRHQHGGEPVARQRLQAPGEKEPFLENPKRRRQ